MRSLSSQLILTESSKILRNSVVQLTEIGISYHNILEENNEMAHTIFYDGIISPPILSHTMLSINKLEIENCGYKIIHFSDITKAVSLENKKTIIDFGVDDLLIINNLIMTGIEKISHFESTDFIIACTVFPNLLLKDTQNSSNTRILWSGTNLVDKKITGQTSVSIV